MSRIARSRAHAAPRSTTVGSPTPTATRGRRPSARTVVAAIGALALLGAAVAQGPVVDDLGREVQLERPAQRVVAMVPTHTEKVCAVGACDRLVGVDAFSNHPSEVEALPDLGSAFEADVEAIVALEPDLVLTDEYSGLHEALAPLGIATYVGTPQTVDEVAEVLREVGALLGREAAAEAEVDAMRDAIDAVAARVEGADRPRVFVELDATPYTVGPTAYLGTLLDLAGGANVVPADLGAFPQVDPEFVVDADPEVILLLDAPSGESAATLAARPGWGAIDAVADGGVVPLTQAQVDLLTRAGPRLPEALTLLADLLEGFRR